MGKVPSWTLGRTTLNLPLPGGTVGQATSIGMNTSLGWGNYNALFSSLRVTDWHGLTAISNFTWGRALGTGQLAQYNSSTTPLTPYDIGADYGPQNFDIKFLYNLSMYYQPPFFKGQHGVLGHILGGWTFSPLFTAQSGSPIRVSYSEGNCTGCEAFGEVTTPGTSAVGSTSEAATGFGPYTGTTSVKYNQYGDTGSNVWQGTQSVGTKTSGTYGLNMFSDPGKVYGEFRPCVLGLDTSCGGGYRQNIRGLPTWNIDMSIIKDIGVYKERVGATFFVQITNILNHFQASDPTLSLTSPTTFGQITSSANTPRNMEFGVRIRF
jgi:hypothetical protein